ncbi:MAG: peptidoglycan-associated lipoprotein Pal [Gammaproteobacteria bacterium]|nr:peptidoglycan-associated lipoprotein Pal [Gammaproteobacteria bacterium]
MIRQLFGALSALLLAGVLLGGCKTTEEPVDPPPTVVKPPVVTPTPPPKKPEAEPPTIGPDGNITLPGASEPLDAIFYFEYDQARLAPADIRVLAMHAQQLRDYRNFSVKLEGHCDERGTREYNLALGERRWQAVRRYLISAGVRSTQIEGTSFGEERPVDPGHDESAWAKNRRAVIVYNR